MDGHSCVEAAKRLGLASIPAIDLSHLTPTEIRSVRLAVNRIAERGEWDLPALQVEVAELTALGVDLSSTGFTVPEFDIILIDAISEPRAEKVPAMQQAAVSLPGDLWDLGEHRVVCGSALEEPTFAALLVTCHGDFPPRGA